MATLAGLLPSMAGSWADDVMTAFEEIVSKETELEGRQSTNQTSIPLAPEKLPLELPQGGSRKTKRYEVSSFPFNPPFEYYDFSCDLTDLTKNAAAEIMRRAENPRKRAKKQSIPCFSSTTDVKFSIYDEDDDDMSTRSEVEEHDNEDWDNRKYGRILETIDFNPLGEKDQLKGFWGMEGYELESYERPDDDKSYNQTEMVLKACNAILPPFSNVDPSISGHGACAVWTLQTAVQGCTTQNPLMGDVLRIEHTETKIKDPSVYKVKQVGRDWWAATPSPLRYCRTVVRKEIEEGGQ